MARSRTQPAVVAPVVDLPELDGHPAPPRAGEELDGELLTGDLTGLRAADVRLLESRLADARLDDAELPRLRLHASEVADCSATSLRVADGEWRDSIWRGGRVGALAAAGCLWDPAQTVMPPVASSTTATTAATATTPTIPFSKPRKTTSPRWRRPTT